LEPPVARTFHICTRHVAPRLAVAAGRVAADFQCPFGANECPMRLLMNTRPGHSLQLTAISLPVYRGLTHLQTCSVAAEEVKEEKRG